MKYKSHILSFVLVAIASLSFAQSSTPPPSTPAPQPTPLAAPATVTVTLSAGEQAALLYAVSIRDTKRFQDFTTQQASALSAWNTAQAKLPAGSRTTFVPSAFVPSDPSKYLTARVAEVLASYGNSRATSIVNANNSLLLKGAKVLTPQQIQQYLAPFQAAVQAATATPAPTSP